MESAETAGTGSSERGAASRRGGGLKFGKCVASKGLTDAFFGCVARKGLSDAFFVSVAGKGVTGFWVVAEGVVGCRKANRKRRAKHGVKYSIVVK